MCECQLVQCLVILFACQASLIDDYKAAGEAGFTILMQTDCHLYCQRSIRTRLQSATKSNHSLLDWMRLRFEQWVWKLGLTMQ